MDEAIRLSQLTVLSSSSFTFLHLRLLPIATSLHGISNHVLALVASCQGSLLQDGWRACRRALASPPSKHEHSELSDVKGESIFIISHSFEGPKGTCKRMRSGLKEEKARIT